MKKQIYIFSIAVSCFIVFSAHMKAASYSVSDLNLEHIFTDITPLVSLNFSPTEHPCAYSTYPFSDSTDIPPFTPQDVNAQPESRKRAQSDCSFASLVITNKSKKQRIPSQATSSEPIATTATNLFALDTDFQPASDAYDLSLETPFYLPPEFEFLETDTSAPELAWQTGGGNDVVTAAARYVLTNYIYEYDQEKGCYIYKCRRCDYTSTRIHLFNQHKATHSDARPYVCRHDHCGASFKQQGHLDYHLKSHGAKKTILCERCDKSFHTKAAHNEHFRIHTGEKPYTCPHEDCKKPFAQRSGLNSHLTRLHCAKPAHPTIRLNLRTAKEKNYFCRHEGCGESFSSQPNLWHHKKIAHGATRRNQSIQTAVDQPDPVELFINSILLDPSSIAHQSSP